MKLIDSISISAIVMGGIIMMFSILKARKLYYLFSETEGKSTWKLMIVLMAAFLFGYILSIVLIIRDQDDLLLQLIGLIFLFGALFVFLAVRSSTDSVHHLMDTTVAKTEKEVLLKEIHHRVKNNLQVITSLLSLQASFINDEGAKAMFRYSQYRISSMAMIHEMLYQSKDLSHIEYDVYLRRLSENLIMMMKGSDNHITLKMEVAPTHLNIDTAIPLGLLVNEILTNALKYGIKGHNAGEIHIRLFNRGNKNYTLEIGDNGDGFPDTIDFRSAKSLGLQLIHKLSLQLKGSIEKVEGKGTNYIIQFREIVQLS